MTLLHLVVQILNPYNLGPKLKLSFEPSDIFELCPRFLEVKRNVALPEDVWLVDLDEAKIYERRAAAVHPDALWPGSRPVPVP